MAWMEFLAGLLESVVTGWTLFQAGCSFTPHILHLTLHIQQFAHHTSHLSPYTSQLTPFTCHFTSQTLDLTL